MYSVQWHLISTRIVFCSYGNKIEFRNKENVNEILLTYSVGSHQPGVLCAVSPSILVYENRSKNPQLHWLDCSEAKPKPLGITVNTNVPFVQDMCIAKFENEALLIVLPYDANELIQAYNSSTGRVKWSVQKKITSGSFKSYSVTGDSNGRIFVADRTNSCIQMFSASNGQYLGCFVIKKDQGLGILYRLRWCEATWSLAVAHHVGGTSFISDIH